MSEALGPEEPAEQLLPDVPERGMPDVVAHGHGLDEIFIQAERTCHRAADLRDLERVRQTRAVVVADRREEDLGLVLQPAERLAVDDAIAVERERGTGRRRILGRIAMRIRGAGRVIGEIGLLELLGVLADAQRGDGAGPGKFGLAARLCGHFAAKANRCLAVGSGRGQWQSECDQQRERAKEPRHQGNHGDRREGPSLRGSRKERQHR